MDVTIGDITVCAVLAADAEFDPLGRDGVPAGNRLWTRAQLLSRLRWPAVRFEGHRRLRPRHRHRKETRASGLQWWRKVETLRLAAARACFSKRLRTVIGRIGS